MISNIETVLPDTVEKLSAPENLAGLSHQVKESVPLPSSDAPDYGCERRVPQSWVFFPHAMKGACYQHDLSLMMETLITWIRFSQ